MDIPSDFITGQGHIVIGGTGRSGTTLLVQILTHLNFDTGFSKEEVLRRVDSISRAGLERRLTDPNLPYVIKSPWLVDHISEALDRGISIEAAIFPFRNLFDAAESRRHVYRQAESLGKDPIKHPGSIWKTAVPSEQEDALARQFYKFLEPLVAHNVPLYFLSFPRFVEDPNYFYDQLEAIFSHHNVRREEVVKIHGEIADTNLITRFTRTARAAEREMSVRQQHNMGEGSTPSQSRVDTYLSPVSFWWPEYFEQSAWIDHAPFAFWLMEAHRPRTFVELGTHGGYSYFAFCQAVKALNLQTRCYAVDTWKGDEHAGFYGDEVFERVGDYNERHYDAFSRLLRSTFDTALSHFTDGSVDLLHIDGRHFYEDVKHDFESWRPKLSEQAVVLFHDINVRERNFGVFRIWEELRNEFPSFEFWHGHGLGVLGYGKSLPERIKAFLDATSDSHTAAEARQAYSRLGGALKADFSQRQAYAQVTANRKDKDARIRALEMNLESSNVEAKELAEKIHAQDIRTAKLEKQLGYKDAIIQELESKLKKREHDVQRLLHSTSWRITKPFRTAYDILYSQRVVLSSPLSKWFPDIIVRLLYLFFHPLMAFHNWKIGQNDAHENTHGIHDHSMQSAPVKDDGPKTPTGKLTVPRLAYREFLIRSLFNPKLATPFNHDDEYFVSFMRTYGRYLESRYRHLGQSKLVSIIMPTFNRAHCIGDAIRSVIAQTYTNWELIIVDDCSTDNTAICVSSFTDRRITYLQLQSNIGAAGARNAGLEMLSGDLIAYLDTDNTMDPNFLLILVNELEMNYHIDMVYSAQRAVRIRMGVEEDVFIRFAPFHRPSLENNNYIDLGVVLYRRSLVDQFGMFNAQMKRLSDWEYILRCTTKKFPKAVPVILSTYYYNKADNRVSNIQQVEDGIARTDSCLKGDLLSSTIPGIAFDGVEQMYSPPYKVPEPLARRPVSIVIPSFEAEPFLRSCVEAIYAFSSDYDLELIIVDNASSRPVVSYLNKLEGQGRAKVLLNEVNYGFTFAVNQGINVASPKNDIVIMNNDAIVTRGWLGALQAVLDDNPQVGLVVPTQTVLGGEKTLLIHQPHRIPTRECDINVSAHHANVLDPHFDIPKGYIELAYAPFFCIYVPRQTLDLCGLLDVENGPHYRSDRLYCDLVRETAMRRIIYTPHSKVYHLIQRATQDLKKNDITLYEDMFVRNDWSKISLRAARGQSPQPAVSHATSSQEPPLKTAAEFWSKQTRNPSKRLQWGHFPAIRSHVTKRIVGKEMYSIPAAVLERAKKMYHLVYPLGHGISVGAGTCIKEIYLAKFGYVLQWDCFEISETRLEVARKRAVENGVVDRINFRNEDAFRIEAPLYDLVLWSHSLHHMFDTSKAIQWSLDHLKAGGLFIMDDYVGPNRFQWSQRVLDEASQVRKRLDDRFLVIPENPKQRFPRKMKKPDVQSIIDTDPTESVDSERILDHIGRLMPSADIVHLGGIVYHVALSGILTNFTESDDPFLKELLILDGELADRGQSVLAAAMYQKPLADP